LQILVRIGCAFCQIGAEVFKLVGSHVLRACDRSLLVCALAEVLRSVSGFGGRLFQDFCVCFGSHVDALGFDGLW